mgnify:CR=1 FL=1
MCVASDECVPRTYHFPLLLDEVGSFGEKDFALLERGFGETQLEFFLLQRCFDFLGRVRRWKEDDGRVEGDGTFSRSS